MELNKIHLCDCLTGLKQIEENSIDLVVTSPPYNMGNVIKGDNAIWLSKVDYSNYTDDMEEEAYQKWQIEILNEIYRVLKPGGSLFYNHKIRSRNNVGILPSTWIMKSNLTFRQLLIWERNGSVNVSPSHYLPNTELIYWMTKGNTNVRFNRQRHKFKDGHVGAISEVWKITAEKDNEHPAPFPVELVDMIIPSILGTDEMKKELGNITVLDPFIGSGTTAISAIKNGCNWIGFEISEKYKKIAEDRIRRETLEYFGDNIFGENLKENDFSFEEMESDMKKRNKEKHFVKNVINKKAEEPLNTL